MVALKPQQAKSFTSALEPRINAVLLYGEDAGLVAERAKLAAEALARRSKPPGEILRIGDADLENDPDRFHTELQTVSMFGGARVVRTQTSRRIHTNLLKSLIEPGTMTGALVVEAGALRADDALRKLFEGAPTALAVPCNPDEAKSLEAIVAEAFAAAGVEIAQDARQLLVSRLGADRVMSRSEIDKLLIYAHGEAKVTIEAVEAVVGDASEQAIDTILFAVSGGRGREAVIELDRAVASGESPQGIILATQRHFQRLHRLRAMSDQGRSFVDAFRSLRPPLPYKLQPMLESHARAWDAPRLDRAQSVIARAAKQARLSSGLEATLAERMLLEVAALAPSPRR